MKLKHISACASVLAGSILASLTVPAQAATFTQFNFDTNRTGNNPKGNITLNSVTFGSSTVSNFILVSGVENFVNENWTGGDTGAASSERGDNATGVKAEAPTSAQVATSLGNLNLNNIIDTEDNGAFSMEVRLASAANHFFFWERGMNSRLMVEALDQNGVVLATTILDSRRSQYAGYSIDTTEISGSQAVGSMGLKLDAHSDRLRLTSFDRGTLGNFNGPDFKVTAAHVPEPASLAGLGLVAGAIATLRRRSNKQA
ncbi:PEP-CTERM sorting domain-containing protein [Oscillatoria sp. FACHB-1407]|uniref:exosortase-dependent surface protein XDP2 n=1 Tax=Oscillatoria sp. FACHB-1407 TaxID=2692847 RepID=UPI0016873458|nr:exosortase-dependent surface protein XDP2 [Oscillatoria sp. FACHB-1407]MBD2465344.1 PEP-CTERM sorting domain-containing protein [Oscillatoria sp. FACHB-1407]